MIVEIMNKFQTCLYTLISYNLNVKYMARGQRRTLKDKIIEKEELVNTFNVRIEKETKELKALLREQK